MKLRTLAFTVTLLGSTLLAGTAQAQGFVFGTAQPGKPEAATPNGARSAKVETAQRLLARMGLLRETPSGTLTTATQEAIRAFTAKNGLPATNQVTDALVNAIRRVIWQTQNWSGGNYKGREKLVDAAGLREAQILLGKLGFDAGPLDGTFGPQTQVSTEAFQESQSVTVDGLITATVLMNLRRAVNGVGANAKETVRVLNWPDYIEPSVLQDFEKEHGIRVVYDIFASNDDLQTKIQTSKTPYDVVFPTANAVPAMAAKGLLGKLDKASLKNISNIDPRVDAPACPTCGTRWASPGTPNSPPVPTPATPWIRSPMCLTQKSPNASNPAGLGWWTRPPMSCPWRPRQAAHRNGMVKTPATPPARCWVGSTALSK
jgi:peptidoglycan hydrolase-like protein with peptidoglycan-binding domain